ncbi:hypothetical protein [Streptosporangium carneum]|uniref:Uncharacterized protein n=1 Tax=Streptosporangium carneum TaxID=47481 RepID=A0A9W6HVX5_9ACTN|nr:hypothetical protein [Streptosporangium carneum]GLK06771.1 hypothetical protein GCM10017600_01760 [Streptosporangium carneum]
MTPLERRYRWLLFAYPPGYRAAHGQELLGVLLDCAAPGRTTPEVREAVGLVTGGLRERVRQAARGDAWRDGLHLGVTVVMTAQLAVLLPYAGSIPGWVALSALALLAVLRGRVRLALPLVSLTGAKAMAVATAWQPVDVTLLPVYPGFLTAEPLFAASAPVTVALGYGFVCCGLLALAAGSGPPRTRSWRWAAAVPFAAWTGPGWMPEGTPLPLSLSRTVLELAVLCLAVWAARTARDLRWALAAVVYLLAVSVQLGEHLAELTRQHLAYWGLLVFLTALTALVPYGHRRRVPD